MDQEVKTQQDTERQQEQENEIVAEWAIDNEQDDKRKVGIKDMSFLSLLGMIIGLFQINVCYQGSKNAKTNFEKVFTQIYYALVTVIIITEVILAWKIGPGLYGMQFFPN